jgi:hypothetical protein
VLLLASLEGRCPANQPNCTFSANHHVSVMEHTVLLLAADCVAGGLT